MTVLRDIRLAFRLWRRAPLPAAIALLSIALSVGATAVVFAAIKSVLIDPLPYAHPASLVQLGSQYPRLTEQSHFDWIQWNEARELARRTRTLDSIGVYANAVFDLAGDSNTPPEALYGLRVTANLFPLLGVSPMLGRNILPEEGQPGHAGVVILSYGLWMRRFHSDRTIVGQSATFNDRRCLIIGVMPPEFNFPLRRAAAHTPSPYVEFWAAPFIVPHNPDAGLGGVSRLRPHVSLDQARQDLRSISRALANEFPATNRDRVLTVNLLRDRAIGTAARGLLLLMAAAALFMLIGCANVANLLLARALARQREVSIRLAIGAGPWRIVRQFLTESCTLAALGGLAGYALAAVAWRVLPALAPVSIPRLAAARAGLATLAFSLAVAIANGVLFGIAPALRMALSKQHSLRTRPGVRSSFAAAEVAVTTLLVIVGAQLLAGFLRVIATDPGFEADRVIASVVLPAFERYPDAPQRALFYRRILDAVRAIPGAAAAGTTDALPFSGENHGGFISAAPPPAPALTGEVDVVGGDYLQTMGIHLVDGRWFRPEDMAAASDAAIVNTFVARRLWPNQSPIGRRVCIYCTPEQPDNWKRVVGVVRSATHAALDEPEKGNVYLAGSAMENAVFLVVRTSRPPVEIENAIRRAIAAIDPKQPVFLTVSMHDLVADSIADRRFIMMLLAITGCLALIMTAAGVYGVISYSTSRRTREIGIRMALGATPRNVFALIFRQGLLTAAVGLAIGLVATLISMRGLRSLLPGLGSPAASVYISAGLITAISASIACWIPSRRATRTNPNIALRHE